MRIRITGTGVGFDGSKKVKISFVDEEDQKRVYEEMIEALENPDVPSELYVVFELFYDTQITTGITHLYHTRTSFLNQHSKDILEHQRSNTGTIQRLICACLVFELFEEVMR